MADAIMKAFVQFRADDTGLKQDAEAKVKAATANLTGTAKLDLDTTQADRKRTELQSKLSALGARAAQIRITADDKDSLAKIAALQVRLASLDKRTANPKISVEGAARAEAQILALDAQLSRMDKTAQSSRGGLAGLVGEITGFGSASTAASGQSSTFARSLAAVNLATGVLEPALAGLVVAAGGLTAAYAAAGVGIGVFGAVASSVLSQASDAAKNYAKAQEAAAKAENPAQRTAALKAQQQALAGLDTAQKQVVTSILAAQDAWNGFTKTATPGVAKVLADAVALLPRAFQLMQPFLAPVETALRNIIAQIKGAIAPGTQFSQIIGQLAAASGPMLQQALTAAGNILMGVLGVIRAFLPAGQQLSGWVVDATAKFREWGLTLQSHTGFQSLMTMFREQAPQAMEILRNLGTVILNVGKAMTGLSTFSNSKMLLQALLPLSGLLVELSKNRALVNIALYLYAIHAAASKLGPVLTTVRVGITGIGAALKFASANPIVLVAAAVVALGVAFYEAWQKSAGFREGIKTIGQGVLQVGIIIVSGVKLIVDTWMTMVGTIIHGAAVAFGWVPGLGGKLKEADRAFQGLKTGVDNSLNGVIGKMKEWQAELDNSRSRANADIATIVAAFQNQAKASDTAKTALDRYTQSVQQNGAGSQAAKAARDALVADLVKAGVNASTARTDVANYTTAITQNGVNSTAAGAARQKLVSDILAAGTNARQGRADMDSYNTAVIRNGTASSEAQAARAKLIQDLVNSGMSAQQAARLVDGLGGSIKALPGSKQMQLIMTGKGTYSLSEINAATGKQKEAGGTGAGMAAGGLITGGIPGRDSVLIRAMPGELIVPTHLVPAVRPILGGRIPGFASGGLVQRGNMDVLSGRYPQMMYSDFQAKFTAAMVAAMRGAMAKAIAAAQAAAASMSGTAAGTAGAGVQRWRSLVLQALAMLGLPASLVNAVLYQMQTESGGNPNAINLWDSNAAAGHPSQGLMQVIPSTFAAYHVAGTSNNILDPLANIAAALNYAAHNKGFGSGPGQVGSGHGYDRGGWLPPGLSVAWNGTGRPERVVPPGGRGGADDLASRLDRLIAQIERLTEVTAAAPARTGQHVGAAVNGGAAAAAFRVRYPAGGIR